MTTKSPSKLDADTIISALGSLTNDKHLAAIRDACDEAITANKKRRMQEIRNQFSALAADSGLTLDDILGPAKSKRGPRGVIGVKRKAESKAMFDPVANKRWSGRGRMPIGFDRDRAVASA